MNCFDMNAYTFLLIFLINDQKTSQKKFLIQNDFSFTMGNDFLCQTTGCHYSCLLPQFLFDGASILIPLSWEALAVSASRETPTPGRIIPPTYCFLLLTTDAVVAVPISIRINGTG